MNSLLLKSLARGRERSFDAVENEREEWFSQCNIGHLDHFIRQA
jgi:hypothetical protein